MIISAFLLASAVALAFGRGTLAARIETYARGMGEANIMTMGLIFVLAGAFAGVAKGSGAVDAAVAVAQALVPARFLLGGLFLVSCLISLAIGTSCGTIAALTPIAMSVAEPLGLTTALPVGAVVGGAMFGDNLSLISDTTIAATRTQGIAMREKFFANLSLAIPAAVLAFAVYAFLGFTRAPLAPEAVPVTGADLALVSPYVLILVLALLGHNVMALLFGGTVLSVALGVCLGRFGFTEGLSFVGQGALGMGETLIIALLAGGLFATVKAAGGIARLTDALARVMKGPRSCEAGTAALVGVVNLFTANNTVAIVVAGPVAKVCSDRFGAKPARIASVLDTTSCVVQGLIPYGAQILIATALAREADPSFSATSLIASLYYQPLLALALVCSFVIPVRRGGLRPSTP